MEKSNRLRFFVLFLFFACTSLVSCQYENGVISRGELQAIPDQTHSRQYVYTSNSNSQFAPYRVQQYTPKTESFPLYTQPHAYQSQSFYSPFQQQQQQQKVISQPVNTQSVLSSRIDTSSVNAFSTQTPYHNVQTQVQHQSSNVEFSNRNRPNEGFPNFQYTGQSFDTNTYKNPQQSYNNQHVQHTSPPLIPFYNQPTIKPQGNYLLDSRQGGLEAQQNPTDSSFMSSTSPRTKRPITPEPPPPLFNDTVKFDKESSLSMEKFSLQLLANLIVTYENQSFMISPYSIHTLLLLIAEGSTGSSLAQIKTNLMLKSIENSRMFDQYLRRALNESSADAAVSVFSALVTDVHLPVNQEYTTLVEKVYGADVFTSDFKHTDLSARRINDHVKTKTDGLITEIIKPDDLVRALMVLISGVNFNGRWKHVFNETFTKSETFYAFDGVTPTGTVNMMFQTGPFGYAAVQDLGAHVLELPYGTDLRKTEETGRNTFEERLSMILVLPRKGLQLIDALENVNKFGMERLYNEMKQSKAEYEDEEIEVHLPRFETETTFDMVELLKEMGIVDIFEQSATLTKIHPQDKYYISSMIHKSKIQVTEKGTKAAAVTASIFANKSTPPKFHANRPFLYFIVDRAVKSILFTGQYVVPQKF